MTDDGAEVTPGPSARPAKRARIKASTPPPDGERAGKRIKAGAKKTAKKAAPAKKASPSK